MKFPKKTSIEFKRNSYINNRRTLYTAAKLHNFVHETRSRCYAGFST